MENLETKGVLGNFRLSEEVVSAIVAAAAEEVPGVAGLAEFRTSLKTVLNKDIAQRATKIKMHEGAVSVNLCINILLGVNLKEVAQKVQVAVKEAIQNMTGLVVSGVNVAVAGVKTEKSSEVGQEDEKEGKGVSS